MCNKTYVERFVVLFALLAMVSLSHDSAAAQKADPSVLYLPNSSGTLEVLFTEGRTFDRTNPFFQNLGANGRTCFSCHRPGDGWVITPPTIKAIFLATRGLDPLFNPVDGTNSPYADVSTLAARRAASSMLLDKGLIRIGLPIPANAEFTLAAVYDPYGFAAADELSLFRRPLPATNLHFLTGVMIDARESGPPPTVALNSLDDSQYLADLITDLKHQANTATRGHAQAAGDLSDAILSQIVDFELHTITAQAISYTAGALNARGTTGGPLDLSTQLFYVTINDVLGNDKNKIPFTPNVFTLFEPWVDAWLPSRAQIQRGEVLFNTRQFDITGVAGINDDLDTERLRGTRTTCHDSPNAGDHSVPLPINIGTSDVTSPLFVNNPRLLQAYPIYTLRNKTTDDVVQTTDPGRTLITGKWKDIGKVKGPVLRGLAARAPYFHNGSAPTLEDAINFYDDRFNIGFTPAEVEDLAAFLRSL